MIELNEQANVVYTGSNKMTDISELPMGRGSGVVVANEDDSVDNVGVTLDGSDRCKQAFGHDAHVTVGSDAKHAGKDNI